jgi:Protein of unknown function (DUF4235)
MKLIYKPFGLIFGLVAGQFAKKIFNVIWGVFDEEEPPKPTTRDTSWAKVVGAAAVQGITFKVVRAIADRGAATGFSNLTGSWPGPKTTDKSQAAEAVR